MVVFNISITQYYQYYSILFIQYYSIFLTTKLCFPNSTPVCVNIPQYYKLFPILINITQSYLSNSVADGCSLAFAAAAGGYISLRPRRPAASPTRKWSREKTRIMPADGHWHCPIRDHRDQRENIHR